MQIEWIERFTIPIDRGEIALVGTGTTVAELIAALKLLPSKGIVSPDYSGDRLYVTHYNPPLKS